MGKPLDMPVEDRSFSEEYSQHWVALMNAHDRFMITVSEYSGGPRAGSVGKWKLVKRRFAGLCNEMQNCDAFVGRRFGGEQLSKVRDGTASQQEQQECHVMAFFLTERAMPFAAFWESAIDAVDDGTPLTIKPGDIPRWTDEE